MESQTEPNYFMNFCNERVVLKKTANKDHLVPYNQKYCQSLMVFGNLKSRVDVSRSVLEF